MAGKGRPGGNPDIVEHGFKRQADWRASCTAQMSLRMPEDMKQAIKDGKIGNWGEVCRRAIAIELGWSVSDESESEE